jgi:iron(III) transport system permease protein
MRSSLVALLVRLVLLASLTALIGWPLLATALEAGRVPRRVYGVLKNTGWTAVAEVVSRQWGLSAEPSAGISLDPAGTAAMMQERGGLSRPARLARETLKLVGLTEVFALLVGVPLAFLLFRTDVPGRRALLFLLGISVFVPLPLHATAWLGAFGNVGRAQAIGIQPFLVGIFGAAVVHAIAALPWVVFLAGIGFCTVERELEEAAELEMPRWAVAGQISLRRSVGAIAAAALAVAVLTAGDMTVTDLLQIRTYAEEAYIQFTLGKGPADAAAVSVPPFLVLGGLIVLVARALFRADPARLVSAFAPVHLWPLRRWRAPLAALLVVVIGNAVALPIYTLIWRAGRVGGRARLGQPPEWSFTGFWGTLQFAASEIEEPIVTSLLLATATATLTAALAWLLSWVSRRSTFWQFLLLAVLALTLATPGPVAGMAMELAYRWYPPIYDTATILILAQTMRVLPYAVLVLWPALRTLPSELLESAALDGCGPGLLVWRVALPLSRRALFAAWCCAFVLAIGELPATNLLQPPGVTTITYRIWALLHTGVESHLAGVALVTLGVIGLAALVAAVGVSLLFRTRRRAV